jgi:hypothetical protein
MPQWAERKDVPGSLIRQFSKANLGVYADAFVKHLACDAFRRKRRKTASKFLKPIRGKRNTGRLLMPAELNNRSDMDSNASSKWKAGTLRPEPAMKPGRREESVNTKTGR